MTKNKLRVVPLGGASEVGRNMWVFEYEDDIVICDMGVMFPESEMMGVDLVLPDITYLRDKTANIRAVLLTHGHEDHIGAVPWLIGDLGYPPIYATTLTHGLLTNKLKEHRLLDKVDLQMLKPGDTIKLGQFTIEPFHISHSIPDCVAFGLTTPAGLALYITDWKLDHTPVDNWPTEIDRLVDFGRRNPIVLVTDCVRVESKGYTPSERVVSDAFDQIFATAPGRVIMATFASNISRVQMAINAAADYGRKVVPIGRSMENNTAIARELGFLTVPEGVLIKSGEMKHLPDDQIAIVCTGSQGEPMAALSRMANRDHRSITIQKGDTVVISASPIPGNEVSVYKVIDNLYKLGANVIYGNDMHVHVSGHAAQEELKMLLNLVQPQYVVPFHGDYRHLARYKQLAEGMGFNGDNVFMAEPGTIMEFSQNYGKMLNRAPVGHVFVDGVTVGDIGGAVVRDRQMLSKDGILMVVVSVDQQSHEIVAGPDIVSRGFVSMRDSNDLIDGTKEAVRNAFKNGYVTPAREFSDGEETAEGNAPTVSSASARKVKEVVGRYLYEKTKRRPMVIPVVMEV